MTKQRMCTAMCSLIVVSSLVTFATQAQERAASQADCFNTEPGVDVCVICLEELKSDVDTMPCGHQFHSPCKAKFLSRLYLQCPCCRDPSVAQEVIVDHIRNLCDGSQKAQANAAGILANLAVDDDNQNVIRAEGGIKALISVLREGSQIVQVHAARALANLALHSQNRGLIFEEVGIPALLREGSQEARATAAHALFAVLACGNTQNQGSFSAIDDGSSQNQGFNHIQALMQALNEANASHAFADRAPNSENHDVIREVNQGLVKVLHEGSQEAQADSAHALVRLADMCQNPDVIPDVTRDLLMILSDGRAEAKSRASSALQVLMKVLREGSEQFQVRRSQSPVTGVELFAQNTTNVIALSTPVLLALLTCSGIAVTLLNVWRNSLGTYELLVD